MLKLVRKKFIELTRLIIVLVILYIFMFAACIGRSKNLDWFSLHSLELECSSLPKSVQMRAYPKQSWPQLIEAMGKATASF